VVMSKSYAGTVESETLIHIGTNGKIKSANKLTCNISPANPEYGYYPPTEDEVNAFYDRLTDSSADTIGDVDLVTNATNTSTNVVASVTEALVVAKEQILNDLPTAEADIKALALELIGDAATLTDVTPEDATLLRRLYRIEGNGGYIAYTVVINERYGRVETETLLYLDAKGAIKDINKMTWKTSDAGWGYVPPEEAPVNAFYESLKGKNLADIEALIALENNEDGLLVTNATTTSKALLGAIKEALVAANAEIAKNPASADNLPRTVGLAIVAAAFVCVIVVTIILKRRRRG